MDNKELTSSQRRGNVPLVIPQLLQASTRMRHIDELLLWLANVVVQRLDVQVMQLWANQAAPNGQLAPALRTNICEDTSLPQSVVYNPQIIEVIGRALYMRQNIPLQPVNNVFTSHQGTLFLRYGLHYCLGYFLSVDALLPPAQTLPPHHAIATPCAMMALLVLRRNFSQEVFVAMQHMFEQAILIAARRGLLLPAHTQNIPSAGSPVHSGSLLLSSQQLPPVLQLIPRRVSNTEAMKADNPFAVAAPSPAIKDRNALRLYQAIDGKRTVADLAAMTRLREKDVTFALQVLLKQKLIQLFTAEGQMLDSL